MSKSLIGKLVKINWLDHSSYSSSGWRSLQEMEALTPSSITTVGWVIVDNKKFVVISATHSDENHYQGDFCILKGTINKIKVLK